MSDLRQAAQAVVDRWDSPLWKAGSTADAIAALRIALEEAEQRRAEFSEATQRNKDHAEWYLKTNPQQAEALQAMNDQLTTGTSIMLDGKRVDPPSVYKQAEPVAWPQLSDDMEYAAQDEFHILPPRMKRLWKRMQELYTAQPQRKPLTDEEIKEAAPAYAVDDFLDFNAGVRFAEAAHGIKGEV